MFFSGPDQFAAWLAANHGSADELWMGLNKRHVADRGLTWADAVVEALCWGWIDSRSEPIDDDTRRQRWTPRRPGSNWSAINIATAERLIAEGRMQPAGLAAYQRRRPERSGIYSYEQGDVELPAEYAARLDGDRRAAAFWREATPSYRKLCSKLGDGRQTASDARHAADATDRRLRQRPPDPQPALRRTSQVVAPSSGCCGRRRRQLGPGVGFSPTRRGWCREGG